MSQTKHSTGTELESKQLTIQMGQTEQEDDLIRRMITGWITETLKKMSESQTKAGNQEKF